MLKHLFSRNNIIILLMGFYISFPFNLILNNGINTLLFSDLLITFIIVCIFFVLFSLNGYLLFFVFSFFVLLNSLFFYMNYFMNVDINLNIVMAIFQTNIEETLEQIQSVSWKLIPYLLITTILPIYLSFKYKIKSQKLTISSKNKLGLITIFIFLTLISLLTNLNKIKSDNDPRGLRYIYLLYNINISEFPINYVYNIGKYLAIQGGDFTFSNIYEKHTFTNKVQKQPYNIVLVIGETARSDRFSLGGYKRKTNPLLEKRENLVYFNNFYSCNTGTIPSVSCLMGFKSGVDFRANLSDNLKNNVESFVPIFKNANFDTYLISTNSLKPKDPMFQRFKDINNIAYITHTLGNKDASILPLLQKIIVKENKNKPNKLIILHTMGSHFKYSARYTDGFQKWEPVCNTLMSRDITNCKKEHISNEYDNTIIYTDFILNSIMDILNNTNTMLIYVSDHGESLGENHMGKTQYLHGSSYGTAPVEQIHIPGIIWFSDSWIKNFGNNQLVNAKSKKNNLLNHDFISFSMLDCGFIESNFIDKSLSLCSTNHPKKIILRSPEDIKIANN